MPENLTAVVSSAIAALDALNEVLTLQELIRIALEEFDHQGKKTKQRVDMLLSIYLGLVEEHFEELQFNLTSIQLQGRKSDKDSPQETESQNPFQL